MTRKQILEYIREVYGEPFVCDEPLLMSNERWVASLGAVYAIKIDEVDYVVSFRGLGDVEFSRTFVLTSATPKTQVLALLTQIINGLSHAHASTLRGQPVESP